MDFHLKCRVCDRKIRNKTGYCNKCKRKDSEQAARSQIETHDDTLILENTESIFDDPKVAVDPYHGSTSRDDI